ncbi:cholinesterase 1-like [Patiria miniata]|uniref:Carboxylesterase type B domain-containing protein n=1 Tax=Patiria miniata TaxID=46514 RepID=A0A914B7B1_PATMI|nr:cholinesterase 1-like [Patiria miniata]
MEMHSKFICLLICLALSVAWASSDQDPPVVTTRLGRIVGTRLQFNPAARPELRRSVDAYLGIPYAEPPVGTLRFKPPVAKSPWSGELQATEVGNRCPQPLMPMGNNVTLGGNIAEDCLSVDVFVPQPVPQKAAVLVYIHGGGFLVGAGSIDGFYATPTAAIGDVIAVALNYRIGALGFLSTGDDVIPGNMGLLDQQLALQWIRDNIQAFGGDPERVAIFGESVGASSVGAHMLSPGSAGLFRATIMESGDASALWSIVPSDEARKRAFMLGKLLDCQTDSSDDLLKCLQNMEFNAIIDNQFEKMLQELGAAPMTLYGPVVDGRFLLDKPINLYAEGVINDAVSILGSNSNEGMVMIKPVYPNNTDQAPFVDSATFDAFMQPWMAMLSSDPVVAEAVKLMYGNFSCHADPSGCDYLAGLSQALGDIMFVCPQDRTARAFTEAGRKVYRYHMTHAPTSPFLGNNWTGCTHGDDLLFVFGVPLTPSHGQSFAQEEVDMAIKTINYWANLAKTGNPNLSSLDDEPTDGEKETEWPVFSLQELAYKDLSPAMPNGRGIKAKECRVWNEFIPKLVQLAEEAKNWREVSASVQKMNKDGGSSDETCTKESCPEE